MLEAHGCPSVTLEFTGVWRLDLSGISSVNGEQAEVSEPKIAAYPNPSSGDVTIASRDQSAPFLRSVRVVDVMGLVVKTVNGGSGDRTLRWDGRDRQGREAASGVYRIIYLRPDGRTSASERILVLR